MNSSKSWSLELRNAADAAPRGLPEFFERAVNGLSPKPGGHEREEAEERQCRCVECAKEGVQQLAVVYNKDVILSKDAPRAADVLREIEEIRRAAESLRNALSSVNDFTRLAFSDVGGFAPSRWPEASDRWGRGKEEPDLSCGSDDWIQDLTSLERKARAASSRFEESRGLSKGEVDKGGNTNLFKEYRTSAEYNLVVQGWNLFQRFRPNEAKGGEGSDFSNFLRDVYAYATGRDAESYSGVANWVKTLARPLRRLDELVARRAQLYSDWKALALDPDARRSLDKEIGVVVYQIAFQQQHVLDLKLGKKPRRSEEGS
ncbi:hypothetical protein [Bradyrhizobium sp. B039]|uniref:hypothetical protein n=1 Tax=Bradyrhizobium sp. B039 TaxID=3140239 RepID=UPI0031845627